MQLDYLCFLIRHNSRVIGDGRKVRKRKNVLLAARKMRNGNAAMRECNALLDAIHSEQLRDILPSWTPREAEAQISFLSPKSAARNFISIELRYDLSSPVDDSRRSVYLSTIYYSPCDSATCNPIMLRYRLLHERLRADISGGEIY